MDDKRHIGLVAAAIVGVSIVAAAYLTVPPRYAIASSNGAAYRLDVRTGEVLVCVNFCQPLQNESSTVSPPIGNDASAMETSNNLIPYDFNRN